MKRLFFLPLMLLAALSVNAQNPYLPLWEHLPDGEPRVFEDPDNPGKLRAYIIGSHDTKYTDYCGSDIRMWSAPVEDLSQWRDEGPIFTHYVESAIAGCNCDESGMAGGVEYPDQGCTGGYNANMKRMELLNTPG